MQNEKCKSCFECTETVIVKVRNDRNSEWRDSSVRRCANDQCWHIVDGTREDRLAWISNVYDYKYFGDYELSPEQVAAVYEAKSLAALSTDAEPTIYVSRKSLEELLEAKGSHVALQTLIHRKPLKSGNGVALYAAPFADPVKTAPAVAVKALRWDKVSSKNSIHFRAQGIFGWLHYIRNTDPDGIETGMWYSEIGVFDDLADAQAAAQSSYNATINSALSAQVQDVAGWQPIETIRKNSSAITCSWWKEHRNRPFIQEGYLDWDGETWKRQSGQDWQPEISHPTHWMPLPASPAPKHGEEG
ncbi:MAG: hypothetical protein PGN22_03170 [Agrobacterium cavarae]